MYDNSEQASITAILGRVHSVKSSFSSSEQPRFFYCSHPFIIGFENGKKKGSAKELLLLLIQELMFLCPYNDKAEGREFTVSLRVVIADDNRCVTRDRCVTF